MQKKVTLSVDEELWTKYIEKLEKDTGSKKGKGHIAPTIEKLIKEHYLTEEKKEEKETKPDTTKEEIEQLTQENIKLKQENQKTKTEKELQTKQYEGEKKLL